MGLFSGLANFVSSAVSVASSICTGIGGILTKAAPVVSKFITQIPVALPGIQVIKAIAVVADIVCNIAQAIGLKKQGENEPDELAVKAEKDDMRPDDFESTEAYIKHLQEDIQLTKEDRVRMNRMSPEERAAYQATGTYLYAKACSEKMGLDTEGLKNPELVGLTVQVLADLAKIQSVLSPQEFVVYSKYLQANGLGTKEFSDYLHNRSTDLATDDKVCKAIVEAMKEINPNITEEQIDQKLYAMNIEE